jgi:cephalosporin hydroxylase
MATSSRIGLQRTLIVAVLLLAVLNLVQFQGRDAKPQNAALGVEHRIVSEPQRDPILDLTDQEISDLYFLLLATTTRGLRTGHFLGVQTLQNPLDVWITQEIIHETKPDVILDIGTHKGGSAALWAVILEHVNPDGQIISIDIEDKVTTAKELPVVQRRVTFLVGSSTDPAIVAQVKALTAGRKVMAILDSLHTKAHVKKELEAYSPLIPVGGYLIVQDTVVDRDDPAFRRVKQTQSWSKNIVPGHGPGAAIAAFLSERDDFEIDKSRERYHATNNHNGFLKRVK